MKKLCLFVLLGCGLGPGCPGPDIAPPPVDEASPLVTPNPTTPPEPTPLIPEIPPPTEPAVIPPVVPTTPQLEIIEPLPVAEQTLIETEQVLTDDELRSTWSYDCEWNSYQSDPLGPPASDRFRLGYKGLLVRYLAYLQTNLNDWPAGTTSATLQLFCLPESKTWQFSAIDGRELWEEWFPPAFDQSHGAAVCLADLPESASLSLANLRANRVNPTPNAWCELEITDAYHDWLNDPRLPRILQIEAPDTYSLLSVAGPSYSDSSKRPRLAFKSHSGINFKLPLPGGKAWLLTTEAGGGDCGSATSDPYHTGNNYYSLDFAPVVAVNNLPVLQTEVPILAAADGVVGLVEPSKNNANGCYVVLQHGRYSTRYLHLAEASIKVVEGQVVSRGDQLGIMGNTGESDGTHLHFGVRFDDLGSQTTTELQQSTLEGHQLDSLKIKCDARGRLTYCLSSNKP